MSTIDQESLPANNRCPNHWATLPISGNKNV